MGKKYIGIILVVILAGIAAVAIFLFPKGKTPTPSPSPQPNTVSSQPVNPRLLSMQDWRVEQQGVPYQDSKLDSKFILIKETTGEKRTLVESTLQLRNRVKEVLSSDSVPGGALIDATSVYLTGSPKTGTEVYFALAYETYGPVFGLDINSLQLRHIRAADGLTPHAVTGSNIFAPTGDRAIDHAGMQNPLELICFAKGTKMSIVTPKAGETFSSNEPGISEVTDYAEVHWLNTSSIQYKVYKIVPNPNNELNIQNLFLRTETKQVPSC